MFLDCIDEGKKPMLINSAMVHRISIEREIGSIRIVARTEKYHATIWEKRLRSTTDWQENYECEKEAVNKMRELAQQLTREA